MDEKTIIKTTFEGKFEQCESITSFSFSLSKLEILCYYGQDFGYELSIAYFNYLFTVVRGSDKPISVEESISHIDDDFED